MLTIPQRYRFEGQFVRGKINGQGTMLELPMQRLLVGHFQGEKLSGVGLIKYLPNRIEYFGEIRSNMKNGKGAIKFFNNYKFEGQFKDDEIDTSSELGRIVSKELEIVEEGKFSYSKDQSMGIFETTEAQIYVLDLKRGLVHKTISPNI